MLRRELAQHAIECHQGRQVPATAGLVVPRVACPVVGCARVVGRNRLAKHLAACAAFVVTCNACRAELRQSERAAHRCAQPPPPLPWLASTKA